MLIYSLIVTYNGLKWIDKCLDSLINSTVPTKILVIDNNSTDGTIEKIQSKFTSVEIIKTNQNLGFGNANNIGLTRALDDNADFVFLLNQDAWIENDTIEKLVSSKKSEYAILSPVHLNGKGDALDFAFAEYLLNSLTPDFISEIFLGRLKQLYEIKYANAAAWLIDLKCIKLVGGFDPSFFMYGEDDNYLQRVKYYGFKIGVCPSAKIYHDRYSYNYENSDSLSSKEKCLMMYFKDINKSISGIFFNFFFSQSKAAFKDLLHFNFKKICIYFYIYYYLIVSFNEIVRSRKIAKQRCAFIKPVLFE